MYLRVLSGGGLIPHTFFIVCTSDSRIVQRNKKETEETGKAGRQKQGREAKRAWETNGRLRRRGRAGSLILPTPESLLRRPGRSSQGGDQAVLVEASRN